MKAEEPEFIDPDYLSLVVLAHLKVELVEALDYRITTIQETEDPGKEGKVEELLKFRRFIKDKLYKTGSYKKYLKKD